MSNLYKKLHQICINFFPGNPRKPASQPLKEINPENRLLA